MHAPRPSENNSLTANLNAAGHSSRGPSVLEDQSTVLKNLVPSLLGSDSDQSFLRLGRLVDVTSVVPCVEASPFCILQAWFISFSPSITKQHPEEIRAAPRQIHNGSLHWRKSRGSGLVCLGRTVLHDALFARVPLTLVLVFPFGGPTGKYRFKLEGTLF